MWEFRSDSPHLPSRVNQCTDALHAAQWSGWPSGTEGKKSKHCQRETPSRRTNVRGGGQGWDNNAFRIYKEKRWMDVSKLQKLWDTVKRPKLRLSGTEGCESKLEGIETIYVMEWQQTSSGPEKEMDVQTQRHFRTQMGMTRGPLCNSIKYQKHKENPVLIPVKGKHWLRVTSGLHQQL